MAQPHIVKTTCPRDCYDACGIDVYVDNGAITKVLGDPSHAISRGALCGKCAIAYNGSWRNPTLRLTQPLKRRGVKGAAEFTPISWDEALQTIASRFQGLIKEGAARSILHTHYTGTVGLLGGWFPNRFFNRLGATEVDPDTVCNKAGHLALELAFGDSVEGFDPRTAKDARTILIWGANPSHAAPHQNKGWIADARAAGASIIVVDPLGHDTALVADLHLKLRPGTDAALAFAMLHVAVAEGLTDKDFIEKHVLGADELSDAIEVMSPARASVLCGIPAESIEQAARLYAVGPSLLWLGQGVQRQPQGGNVFRALAALVAFTGNVGKKGAGFMYMNGAAGRGVDMAVVNAPHLASGGGASISHMDFAATLEDPARAQALVNWNNNPAASSPEQGRLRRALERTDLFHVAVDLFHTDTTAYADIVLPAASFLESNDLVLSYFDLTLSAQVKACEPIGSSCSNHEIFRRLAGAMDFQDPELFESEVDLLVRLIASTPFDGTFGDLAKVGTVTLFPEPRIQFASLTFTTPSGKIELASDRAVALGLPRIPFAHADPMPTEGFIRVLSPASAWLMNSSYGNDEVIRRRLGPPTVMLHPADAAANKLFQGDAVILINDEGQLPLTVTISDISQPGVGIVHKGRWPSDSSGGSNVNVLVSNRKSDLAESTAVHGTEVRIIRLSDQPQGVVGSIVQ